MSDLFQFAERYPHAPGFANATTSLKVARKIRSRATSHRERILAHIERHGPRTADELAEALDILIVTARPRCTELCNLGLLVEVGERANDLGNPALIYAIAPPGTPPRPSKAGRIAELEAEVAALRARIEQLTSKEG